MSLYRVWMVFDRTYVSPLTGRPGVWRVTDTFRSTEVGFPLPRSVVVFWRRSFAPAELGILSLHRPARGTFIRPHKVLNAYLQARKQSLWGTENDT